MQFNPFLMSIAAPAAAKSVQTVVHAAHEVGQGFLRTLALVGSKATATDSIQDVSLQAQLRNFASGFREWLGKQGLAGPFEMQFHLANNGDPISSVVGPNSAQIVDAVYSNDEMLERLTAIATLAQSEQDRAGRIPGLTKPIRIVIDSDGAYVVDEAIRAF